MREQLELGSRLIVHSRHPLNAEPPLQMLRSAFVTPAANLYIRCHGDIPVVRAGTHQGRHGIACSCFPA